VNARRTSLSTDLLHADVEVVDGAASGLNADGAVVPKEARVLA